MLGQIYEHPDIDAAFDAFVERYVRDCVELGHYERAVRFLGPSISANDHKRYLELAVRS